MWYLYITRGAISLLITPTAKQVLLGRLPTPTYERPPFSHSQHTSRQLVVAGAFKGVQLQAGYSVFWGMQEEEGEEEEEEEEEEAEEEGAEGEEGEEEEVRHLAVLSQLSWRGNWAQKLAP